MRLVLLLALILPLQGIASAWSCGSVGAASATSGVAAQQHCAHEPAAALQHHGCGTCCCAAAIAVTPLLWVPPRSTSPGVLLPLHWSPPSVVLDRLDRPPRFVAS